MKPPLLLHPCPMFLSLALETFQDPAYCIILLLTSLYLVL